jgi:mannose-6-phosphate isomerase-like protein (cupin superfamily)
MSEPGGRAPDAIVVSPAAGETRRVLGQLVTAKVLADQTGGAYSLFETCTDPDAGVPPHLQLYEDEAWFVLEGRYALEVGGESTDLGPGGYVFVPRGLVHCYRNRSPAPARLLILVSPGGIQERFFAEVGSPPGDPAPPSALDRARAAAAGEKYGLEFFAPSGGVG